MKQQNQRVSEARPATTGIMISRRFVVSSSALAVGGLICGSMSGQEGSREGDDRRREMEERMEESRAFGERLRNASGMEERMKIMEERRAQERVRAIESLKGQLGIADQEWTVIKPRIEKVYDLVHPQRQFGPGSAPSADPEERWSRELRELLSKEDAPVDEIKAKLTALRAVREKARQELAQARQDLRRLMTLRQEAQLVLNGLLD
jgi:hypothetical protein